MSVSALAGHILLGAGGFILLASGLGVLRMPDVWNRLHAGTKATTLGSILFLAGIGCLRPHWIPKLILVALFIVLTNPVSSHALARAAHMRPGEKPENLECDDLEGDSEDGGGD